VQLKTILNRIQRHRSFVYHRVRWVEAGEGEAALEVEIRPRANGSPICSACGRIGSGYDTQKARRFEFVPIWGLAVFFVYAMRRVDCRHCGVTVESVPWAEGKRRLTTTYAWFLAAWARRLSWLEVARAFRTSWDTVFRAVERAVEWGLAHRDLSGITAVGMDEILWRHNYRFFTVAYQIDQGRKRLLWVGKDRKVRTMLQFFRWLGQERSQQLRFVCCDMWKNYLRVVPRRAVNAVLVLDRFHLVARLQLAVDRVRAKEAKELKAKGYEPYLKGTRWCLLKRPENLSARQEATLADLLRYNLKSVRSYLLKEDLQGLWKYASPAWAGKYLDRWCGRVMRSRIEPMKRLAHSFRHHRKFILNWFRARGQVSAGAVEGFNNKAKVTFRKSYGFREFRTAEIALYHALGDLPVPDFAHRFC